MRGQETWLGIRQNNRPKLIDMKILYIHQYFATPKGCTGTRSYEFSKRWVNAGHTVFMLTTVAQLTNEDLELATGCFLKRFTIDGINVCAINLRYKQQMKIVTRCLSFAGFVILSSLYILFAKRPDIIYATSTPLTVGIPALVAKLVRRIPFIFEVRDQWPEIPIELGMVKNKLLRKLLLAMERIIYKNASVIIALSPGMADGVRVVTGLKKRIEVIPNSCDTQRFRPDIDGSGVRRKYEWDDRFVIFHAGAMGKVNSLHFVIDAADKLKDNKDILFVLLGEGKEKASLEKRVSQLGLGNVQILPAVPKYILPEFFAASDMGLVVIGDYPIIQHNSANKFFDSLSAGKPALLNYSGWQREIIESNKAGLGCGLCNLEEFVEKVLYLSSRPQKVKQMGLNARGLAVERFNRDRLAEQVLEVITSLGADEPVIDHIDCV